MGELAHQLLGLALALVGEAGTGNVGVEDPVRVGLGLCVADERHGDAARLRVPPQAPTMSVAANKARTLGAVHLVRLRISIACTADRVVVKGLAMVGNA